MKVRSILMAAACLLFISHYSAAQTPQINNGGFETWETSTTEKNEPTDWNSFKTATGTYAGWGGQQMDRSTQKRPGTSGNYSVVIWSRWATLAIANGNLTTGQINMGNMTPSNDSNYNKTITTNAAFYETLGASPDSLIVWVRFHPVTSTNQGRVHAILHSAYNVHDPINATSAAHVRAEATLNFASTGTTWVRKSIPFVYNASSNTPTYILISFSTNPTAGGGSATSSGPNDSLYVDDLSLFYNPVLTTGTINPLTYLVSSTMSASVSVPFTLTGSMNSGNIVTAQLSDASGSFVSPQNIGTLTATTSGTVPGTIPAGTATSSNYRIRVVSSSYPITAADNGTNITISDVTGIQNYQSANTSVYFSQSQLVVDLQQATYNKPIIQVYNMSGQIVGNFIVKNNSLNRIDVTIPAGIYMFRIMDGENSISGKIVKL